MTTKTSISPSQETSSNQEWFAVRVRSNFERSVESVLSNKGFTTFFPVYHSRRRWSDRVVDLNLPLFPGYIFCRLAVANRFPILTTPGVVGLLGAGRTPIPVPSWEVDAVRTLVESRLVVQPWPFLRVGQQVRIEKGSLTGLEGILVEFKNRYRLVVSVQLMQRSVAAEIDADLVRPIRLSAPATFRLPA